MVADDESDEGDAAETEIGGREQESNHGVDVADEDLDED